MSSDATELVDTTCWVCGAEVRGEKVVWRDYPEHVEEDVADRIIQTHVDRSGGHVCGTCGLPLCSKEHKRQVANVKFMRGYQHSPCPGCGAPLIDGFILAAAPEGSFGPPQAETSSELEAAPVEGAEPEAPSIASIQWKTQAVKDGAVAFACPHCDEAHTFSAELFKNPNADGIEGFGSTGYNFGKHILATLLSLATAAAVFIWVHRAMFGPELRPGLHLIVPALAAVIVHPLVKPVFVSMPFVAGRIMPVYGYTCTQCGGETHMATDGKRMALPVRQAGS